MSQEKQGFIKKNLNDKGSKRILLFVSVAAIAIVAAVAFSGGSADDALPSKVRNAPNQNDTSLPENLNPRYKEQLLEADRQRIEAAKNSGQSATPTIIGNTVEQQEPIEINIEPEKPEIVRPEVREAKPVRPVVIPEPKKEPVKIARPVIEQPRPQVSNGPVDIPVTPVSAPAQQAEVRLVERPVPQVDQNRMSAYVQQMAAIQAQDNQLHGFPSTQYFYTPPAPEADEYGSVDGAVSLPGDVSGQTVNLTDVTISADGSVSDSSNASLSGAEEIPVDLPLPGHILYARMVTTANSDAPGEVVAEILQGELTGARVIGSFSVANEKLVIDFNQISIEETVSGQVIDDTFPISAVAVDTEHMGTAVASDVNRRMLQRIAVTFGTAFVQGMGEAIANSGTSSETDDNGTTTTNTPVYSTEDQAKIAAGQAAGEVGAIVQDYYGNRGVTVKMTAGTPMGILFLQ